METLTASRRRSTILCLLAGSAAARARDPRAAASAFAGETSNRNLRKGRVPRTSRRIWVRPSEAEAAPSRRIPAGEGTRGAGRFDQRRHVKGDARARARQSTRRAGTRRRKSGHRHEGGGRRRRGRRREDAFVRASRVRTRPGASRPDFDAVAGGTTSAPDGTFRGTFRGIPSGTPSGTGTGMHAARPGSCPRALRRRRMRLVAPSRRARRWWQSWSGNARREVASKTARGSGSAAAAFDEASRKLEEWLDRERRSLGSFRRVAAILG